MNRPRWAFCPPPGRVFSGARYRAPPGVFSFARHACRHARLRDAVEKRYAYATCPSLRDERAQATTGAGGQGNVRRVGML